jgi:tetraacyldisaccharide 4'-kinase
MFKLLWLPFSLLYGMLVWCRNKAFDWGVNKSTSFDSPLISIGNLSVGGSGKTPHVEYLVRLLQETYSLAILSRGYGRKTKGYRFVSATDDARKVGDEPLQYAKKFSAVKVAVQEDRVKGLKRLQEEHDPEVMILDDAYQHRWVKPGLNILLTTYSRLYINDYLFPVGRLRESARNAKRADIIIVTKSPRPLLPLDEHRLRDQLAPLPHQKLYFSYLEYAAPVHVFTQEEVSLKEKQVLLLTGIADPEPIKDYLIGKVELSAHMEYKDHHNFSKKDVKKILAKWKQLDSSEKLLLTTEKDAGRLLEFEDMLADLPICYLPVQVKFHGGDEFDKQLLEYVEENKRGH